MTPLWEGGVLKGAQAKRQAAMLVDVSKQFPLDDTLRVGVPLAAILSPDQRSAWDMKLLNEFEAELLKHGTALKEEHEKMLPQAKAAEQAAEDARCRHSERMQRHREALEALRRAQAADEDMQRRLALAESAQHRFEPSVETLESLAEQLEQRSAALQRCCVQLFAAAEAGPARPSSA
eukprot:TRINITY_DN51264_c0_g2_i1.p2 TRINITY_DN51264_c0_g2~~TRINITY_DN51264_c0_g2_i1.p2  ORF type:complete len:178 (-),score=63.06 TRINITY_DN51264_c0_g2_i1:670-1203(-)